MGFVLGSCFLGSLLRQNHAVKSDINQIDVKIIISGVEMLEQMLLS